MTQALIKIKFGKNLTNQPACLETKTGLHSCKKPVKYMHSSMAPICDSNHTARKFLSWRRLQSARIKSSPEYTVAHVLPQSCLGTQASKTKARPSRYTYKLTCAKVRARDVSEFHAGVESQHTKNSDAFLYISFNLAAWNARHEREWQSGYATSDRWPKSCRPGWRSAPTLIDCPGPVAAWCPARLEFKCECVCISAGISRTWDITKQAHNFSLCATRGAGLCVPLGEFIYFIMWVLLHAANSEINLTQKWLSRSAGLGAGCGIILYSCFSPMR